MIVVDEGQGYDVIDESIQNSTSNLRSDDPVRICQNIFVCDHSQLPKEEIDELYDDNHREHIRFEPYEDVAVYKNYRSGNNKQQNFDVRRVSSPAVKCSITVENEETTLMKSEIQRLKEDLWNSSGVADSRIKNQQQQSTAALPAGDCLMILEDIGRPLSRRGSWDDKREEGIEETFSSREDTPQPLGDEKLVVPRIMEIPLISIDGEENCSGSRPYDDASLDADETDLGAEGAVYVAQTHSSEYSTDSENSVEERGGDEDQQYERLQESPPTPLSSAVKQLTNENFELELDTSSIS